MSKYHNIKTEVDGIVFDSKKEAEEYIKLKLLERSGLITDLQRQVKFPLIDKSQFGKTIVYKADFTYKDNPSGEYHVVDVKSAGTRTPVYILKKRLVAEKYGIRIEEV